jgi:hypothetical protein
LSRDYEAEITRFFDGLVSISQLTRRLTTKEEQKQMEGKKAIFAIKGVNKTFAFEVRGTEIIRLESISGVDTVCWARDPQQFLEYCDRVFQDGDTTAFERALQRGDLILRGKHTIHDRVLWRKAFERLATAREAYTR